MKKLFFMLGTIAAFSILISCEGPEGPRGATGPTGPTGNEEVYLYTFGAKDFNAANSYYVTYQFGSLSAEKLNQSLIVIYYGSASEWNMANGPGPVGNYQTIQYYTNYDSTAHVYLRNGDCTTYTGGDLTWDSSRVYVIPPSMIRAAEKQGLDFSDIHEVERFTNVK